jgi:hypothetical protein
MAGNYQTIFARSIYIWFYVTVYIEKCIFLKIIDIFLPNFIPNFIDFKKEKFTAMDGDLAFLSQYSVDPYFIVTFFQFFYITCLLYYILFYFKAQTS